MHHNIKTKNVLVSNQHNIYLSPEDRNKVLVKEPIVCTLTDFGEGRLLHLHTNTAMNTKTGKVDRGTIVCMALVILNYKLGRASMNDLIQVDMWAFGMTVFAIINPD